MKTYLQIIQLLHIILIFSIISSVFINNIELKKFILSILILLFIQYVTNYGRCGLTEIEYMILREKYKEGFIYRLIKPVINISEEYVEYNIIILHIIWMFILYFQIKV
jgi:hypothetical protein